MSSIGSVSVTSLSPIFVGNSSDVSSTLAIDQTTADQAHAAQGKALSQLATDLKSNAADAAVKSDQQALKAATIAAEKADAQVRADQAAIKGGVNLRA